MKKKSDYYDEFDGSPQFFEAVWRKSRWLRQCASPSEIEGILEYVAAEMVNNPRSPYYMYG